MAFSILLICIIILGRGYQPLTTEERYTQDKFVSLRAILAMLIVFGHTWPSNTYDNTVIDHILAIFNNTGYLDTAIFFFLSGLGTYESAKKNENYFVGFVQNKIVKILVPYWLINLLYIIAKLISDPSVSIKSMLLSFVWPLYNTSAWYIFAVFIIYVLMYGLLHILHLRGKQFYICFAGCICVYTISMYFLRIGSWWFVSTFAALIGVLFSDFKENFTQKFLLLPCSLIFLALYFAMIWSGDKLPSSIGIIIKLATATIVPIVVCGMMKHRRIELPLLTYIGKCSYEIYLVQGLFVLYLWPSLENKIVASELRSLLCVVFAVSTGCILHTGIGWLAKLYLKREKCPKCGML